MTFFIWFLLSAVVALIANASGRSAVAFFFLSIILSPFIGFLALIFTKAGDITKCPLCQEQVKIGAIKCKHCASDLASKQESKPVELSEFVICESCEGGTPRATTVCKHCGVDRSKAESTKVKDFTFCGSCSALILRSSLKCESCNAERKPAKMA